MLEQVLMVSSHAPVRGHLCGVCHILPPLTVSSHAPVRGHPCSVSDSMDGTICFKSCPREGASQSAERPAGSYRLFQVMPP